VKIDLQGRVALITGGTAGIGLATALAMGERGAQCWLTYRWGSADLDALRQRFAALGAPPPVFIQSDVGSAEDTTALLDRLAEELERVDIFVSNAANAVRIQSMEDWSLRGLQASVRYSVWPTIAIAQGLRERFGSPRYIIAMSSDGPDTFTHGYDAIAATKAMLESIVRYLATRLRPEGCRVNALRSRGVPTASLDAVFGAELRDWVSGYAPDEWWVPAEEVGQAALGLVSGRMDAVNGQVLTIDRGTAFSDNLMRLYAERDALGLS
jgi:NAD(P)-dependent dehydrogenase (short-subunit alcohol dehydrogenase family)